MNSGNVWLPALVAAAMAVSAATSAAPAPPGLKVKPDLYVQSCTASLAAPPAAMQQVRVTVKVGVRAAAKVSTGPFKVKVEWREKLEIPPDRMLLDRGGGGWKALPEAGVTGLAYDPASRKIPLATRTFTATVPWGSTYQFRATVDPMNRVEEADEGNNTATTELRAAYCEAGQVDLVLTRVRLRRQAGGVVVDAWVTNRCSTDCVSEIIFVVTETTAAGLSRASVNTVASRLDGEAGIGPLSASFPGGGDGGGLTYAVRIDARGGSCPETSTANNACSASLGAGEAEKTITCNPLVW